SGPQIPGKSFQKIRLQVRSFDVFSHIIGANKGDVFSTFSVGGDMDYRESQLQPDATRRRFKPVALFKGPIMTDNSGNATVKFTMPNYVGSVRVMVIAARKNTYASAEKTVPVKTDLMIQPTLPRVLKPGDKFEVPVSVFAMKDKLGKVDVTISADGPVSIVGPGTKSIMFTKQGDKECRFMLETKLETGQAKITLTAKSAANTAREETDIFISPSSSRVYESEEKMIEAGSTINFTIPNKGLKGTNRAKLSVQVFPNMEFNHRLEWLIHYPYGCIEQTTSSVFPQLYLKEILGVSEAKQKEIDKNINAGIDRLRLFQTSSGGFSYWPGESYISEWGTNYAGHFLIEAKKRGYFVPDAMMNNLINYMKRQARNHSGELMERVNRAYVLAISNNAVVSEMNLIKENESSRLNSTQKWMLAAAYKLAGVNEVANNLMKNAGKQVEEYNEFSGSYGSANRDLAIILHAQLAFDNLQEADLLAREIAKKLCERYWYSTQTVGYMLLSLGKYFEAAKITTSANPSFIGYVKYAGGKRVEIDARNRYDLVFNEGFGKEVEVFLDNRSSMTKAFATLSWDGVPLTDVAVTESENIEVTTEYLDENGKR
ncbi:MAG: hypothetical protein HC906_17310, partial [Bacteroidales bacterium]|nr:hypothetical protein [Bacteroidales bacterium]